MTKKLLRNCRILDVMEEKVLEGQSILIEDGFIKKVGESEGFRNIENGLNQNAVYEIDNRFLMPGLIDCHVHLCVVRDPDETDIVSEILELEPNQLDCVIECCGQQDAIDQSLDLLKPGGLLLIVGIPIDNRISLNISKARRKEISIQNVRRQNNCLEIAIERIASGQLDVRFLMTHTGPINKSKELYDKVADYKDGVIKAIIETT